MTILRIVTLFCISVPSFGLLIQHASAEDRKPDDRKPNIVVIVASDLGYGDLGCFGQKMLQTPRLDEMAKQGMRFTQFYAGSGVGGPSRAVMLTGIHTGRSNIRGELLGPSETKQLKTESTVKASGTQDHAANGSQTDEAKLARKAVEALAIQPEQLTVASLLKEAGYATAYIGNWGIGAPTSLSNPNDVGFDHFFGYVDASHARNHFPEFLVRNGKSTALKNVAAQRREYAPDLLVDDTLRFIREHDKRPFFAVLAINLPHANTLVSDKGIKAPGIEVLDTKQFASQDWPDAEKRYAAAIQHVDRATGRVLDLLRELKLEEQTLVIFTSDNGPHSDAGHSADFFDSNGKYRGIRGELFEGSIRVPMIAWWPGTIAAGGENDRQWYIGDLMATAAEMSGVKPPERVDSDSLLPALRGTIEKDAWKRKSPLYWEVYEGPTAQAVRFGKWKAIRSPMITGELQLYDMSNDPAEKRSYAMRRADLTRHAISLLNKHHQPDPNWKVPAASDTRDAKD